MSDAAVSDTSLIVRAQSLREQVRRTLIEEIIQGSIATGQHLAEVDVADRLGVSRQPVREALIALGESGWLTLVRGKGAFVRQPSRKEIDDLFHVRMTLESEAASLASELANAADIEHLEELCRRGRAALAAGDEHGVVAANATLHLAISRLSGNELLSQMISSLDDRVRWHFTPMARARGSASWDEHDLIIEALSRHDGQRAKTLMLEHTGRTRALFNASHDTGEPPGSGPAPPSERNGSSIG